MLSTYTVNAVPFNAKSLNRTGVIRTNFSCGSIILAFFFCCNLPNISTYRNFDRLSGILESSLYSDGHSSGYDTSVTEGGMTSCAEDYNTDTESTASGKKKKRFLGFRRRSTTDLSSTRGRVKKPMWLDSRRCQSDDEGVQIKVYEIDDPRQMNISRAKSLQPLVSRMLLTAYSEFTFLLALCKLDRLSYNVCYKQKKIIQKLFCH